MRIAILSDIHANLRAWNAVLADVGSLRADRILCLGDLVGYGPSPVDVLRSAYRHVHGFVLGNHDAVVAGKMSPDVFNDRARRLILWTRDRIGPDGARFLGGLPLVLSGNGMRCAHANFVRPAAFDYLLEPDDAAASWNAAPEQLLFVGHTHVPGLFVVGASGTPHALDPQDFALEEGKRYIVNVGAVGVPRDADARASYVLYDDVARTVEFHRVPFDMDAFREDVERAGLDPADVPLLAADPRRHLAAIRPEPDFSPPRRPEDEALGVRAEADLAAAFRRRASRWKAAAIAALAAALVVAAGAALRQHRADTLALRLPSDAPDVALARTKPGDGLLPRWPLYLGSDGRLGDWGLFLADRHRQNLSIATLPGGPDGTPLPVLRIVAPEGSAAFRAESPFLAAPTGERVPDLVLTAFAHPCDYGADPDPDTGIRRETPFAGSYSLAVEMFDAAGKLRKTESVPFSRIPGKAAHGWFRAKRSWKGEKRLPREIARFRVVLVGDFAGELDIGDIALVRP